MATSYRVIEGRDWRYNIVEIDLKDIIGCESRKERNGKPHFVHVMATMNIW